MNELKAIELGKIWMKNSINIGHDYEHAQTVEKHALEVFRSLKNEGKIKKHINENLVKLVAWWHDSYKARLRVPTLWAVIFEGYESEKIVERELKNYLSPLDLLLVKEAIRYHNHPYVFFLFKGRFSQLTQILLEADTIEVLNKERLKRTYDPFSKFFKFIILGFNIYALDVLFWFRVLPVSEYTKQYISNFKI